MKRFFIYLATIVAGAMLALACEPESQPGTENEEGTGNGGGNTVAVESVTLNAETLSLEVGDVSTLIATVLPENATDKSVVWDSEDDAVATVDTYGLVTAVAEGSTKITATAGGITAEVTVTVTVPEVIEAAFSDLVENWEELSEGVYAAELPIEKGYSFAGEFDFKDLFTGLPENAVFALAAADAQNSEVTEYYESLTANLAADGVWTRKDRFAHDLNVGEDNSVNGVRITVSAGEDLLATVNFYIVDPVVGLERSNFDGHECLKIDWIEYVNPIYGSFGGLEIELGGSTNWQTFALKHGAVNDINLVALLNDVTNFQDQGPYYKGADDGSLFNNWPRFSVSGTNGEELFYNDTQNGKIVLSEYGAKLASYSKGVFFQQQWSVPINCCNWQINPDTDRPVPGAGNIAEITTIDGKADFVGPEEAKIFTEHIGIYLTEDGHIKTTENYKGAGARISPQMHFEYDYGSVCVSQRYMFMLYLNRRWAAEGEVADVVYPFTDGKN